MYKIYTSRTEGSLCSPYFGESFLEEQFFNYRLDMIRLEDIMDEVSVEKKLVVDIEMDLKEIPGGTESLEVYLGMYFEKVGI